MINIREKFMEYCFRDLDLYNRKSFEYENVDNVRPYDDTTLFCIAGMQQFKKDFAKPDNNLCPMTITNIQPCIRMNDFQEIGDSTHMLYFNMMGMFSFRDLTVKQTIDFWMKFMQELGLKIDYVTIHPDKMEEWKGFYDGYEVEVRPSDDCKWSDGEIGGYCTEFFKNDVEVGNIVNPNGDCIDVGFGLERLDMLVNGVTKTRSEILKETIHMIIKSGYKPSNTKQGYVLRKLLRELYKSGDTIDHEFFRQEVDRQERILRRYNYLRDRNPGKTKEWWYDTHGINLDEVS